MSDKDNITLPREVVEKAVKAFENGCPPTCEKGMVDSGGFHPWGEPALVPCPACLAFESLRTALAAPKQEPSGLRKAAEAVLARWDSPAWEWKKQGPTADLMADLRKAVAAQTPPEDKTHPGYVIGSHWLETAYSRVCAGEAEADVLRDMGWERVDEALTATRDRQASMLRRLEEREAELDAEIGHLRRENERLREELRQSSIDYTRAEVERLLEALAWAYNLRHLRGHSDPVVIPERFAPLIEAALRREETT